ncbi:MAG: hypothetical protein JWN14_2383, partial [Chthonomonadales bacterium]|nr:hypothetical protein [Chthonomonadales bacterium]
MKLRFILPLLALLPVLCAPRNSRSDDTPMPLTVPAFLAYSEPDPEALNIGPKGLTDWTLGSEKLVWYGKFTSRGQLMVRATVHIGPLAVSKFQLTVGEQTRVAQGTSTDPREAITLDFGRVYIDAPGYQRIELRALEKTGPTFADVNDLVLMGPAAEGAQFNRSPAQRGAPSVHLRYTTPPEAQITWFYNEVTAKTDPLWTYYMACGWHRGYFGMQVNSPTERRVIFSVWDSGTEAKDRSKVEDDNRVKLLAKGENVFADSFGNEGTGGHSHLVYNWKTGQTYKFLVAAQPEGDATVYSGYFYFPEKHRWGLIARFRAPKDGA